MQGEGKMKTHLLQCYVGFVGLLPQETLVAGLFLILQGQKLGPV